MMQRILLFLNVVGLIHFTACNSSSTDTKKQIVATAKDSCRQVAEFEPTEAIWLLWSNYDHKKGYSNSKVTLSIINALLPDTKVKLVFAHDSIYRQNKQLLPAKALETKQLEIIILPYSEFWARDMGPAFIIKNNQLAMADFNFNGWSYTISSDSMTAVDEKLDEKIAAHLKLPMISTQLITEGGDHEVNGQGLMIATESVERMRNPHLSLAQMETEFKRILGIKKIIWLKKGLYEDDNTTIARLTNSKGEKIYTPLTTNGHVDEYVRFVNPTTVLLAAVDSADKDLISLENARRLDVNYRILKAATDPNGQPLTIVRIPLPKHMFVSLQSGDGVYDIIKNFSYKDGSVFPKGKPIQIIAAASYLNFLIANETVLMPTYVQANASPDMKKREADAVAVLKSVFPTKKIVPIDALSINLGGGGIHCITRNQPALSK
jgi:agmatine deiminase